MKNKNQWWNKIDNDIKAMSLLFLFGIFVSFVNSYYICVSKEYCTVYTMGVMSDAIANNLTKPSDVKGICAKKI